MKADCLARKREGEGIRFSREESPKRFIINLNSTIPIVSFYHIIPNASLSSFKKALTNRRKGKAAVV